MKRPVWKLPFIHTSLMKSKKTNDSYFKSKIFWFRNSTIPPYMVGKKVRVYNGSWFLVQTINFDMVGTKFGEYSITKRFDTQLKSRMKAKKKVKRR